jgi:hypothetical protein
MATRRQKKRAKSKKSANPRSVGPVKAKRESKQAKVIELLRRPKGATIEELAVATGWQQHSVRGVLSGALNKRLGLTIESTREERGRVYRITGDDPGSRA